MISLIKGIFPYLPNFLSIRLIGFLVGRPFKYHLKPHETEGIKDAKKLEYAPGKFALKWGSGPVIILVHGWGGRGAQWYKVALALKDLGYSAIAPDLSAHGDSKGSAISFRNFAEDLKQLSDFLNTDVYAYIGHSAGGLAMMAARYLENLKAKKFICLATPSYPYPPIKVFRRKIPLSEEQIELFKTYLAQQFECFWANITKNAFSPSPETELLIIYDTADRYLNPGDDLKILALWPDAKSILTDQLGHEKLLRADECIAHITDFIN